MKVSNEIIAGKLIMQIQIFIDNSRISSLEGRYGKVTMIPFTGHVKSEIFTGEIVPGGVDVQIENAAGNRNMCAKYMFRGTDKEGKECSLFVENNGYVSRTELQKEYVDAFPRFITDSKILGEYLSHPRFRSEVWGTQKGVEVRVYDVVQAIDQNATPGQVRWLFYCPGVACEDIVFLCFLSCKVFQNGNVITRNIDSVGFFSVHQFYDVVAVAVNAAIGIR